MYFFSDKPGLIAFKSFFNLGLVAASILLFKKSTAKIHGLIAIIIALIEDHFSYSKWNPIHIQTVEVITFT